MDEQLRWLIDLLRVANTSIEKLSFIHGDVSNGNNEAKSRLNDTHSNLDRAGVKE